MVDKIMKYKSSRLIDPEGNIVWEGDYDDRLNALSKNEQSLGDAYNVMAKLCGSKVRKDGQPWVKPQDITKVIKDLGYISNDGCAPGFFVLLPPHTHLDRVTQAFNKSYFEQLEVQEIEFPMVYNAKVPGVEDLTERYERQNRVFRLQDNSKELRLSYAADPGLLSWLRNKTLNEDRLPFNITSPVQALRKHPSGELGPYSKSRHYKLPDMHMLTSKADAEDSLLKIVGLNSDSIKFWVDDHFAQFIDATPEFLEANPDLPEKMARKANSYTLVNTFEEQPHYYAMRSGILADAGMGAIMLYNIQWDEDNPKRFNITTDKKSEVVIVHANGLTGSGLITTLVGRSLAGVAPKQILPEIAIAPISLIPLREDFNAAAANHADRLRKKGFDVNIVPVKKSLGKTVWSLRDKWQSAYCVIGKDEEKESTLLFQQGREANLITEEDFVEKHVLRMERCRAGYKSKDKPLPF
jgi:threonyl-tRNA synthetase